MPARRLGRGVPGVRGVLALAVTATLAAGCSGSSGSDEPGGVPTETPVTTSAAVEPTPTPVEGLVDPSDPSAYLPVPDGVELTPPGTALQLRERARAAWLPRAGLVGVVRTAVTRIELTSVAESLTDYVFEGDLPPDSVPYFVTVKATNAGETDLGGRQLPFYVVDDTGTLVAPTGIERDFDLCPGGVLPAVFAPGDQAESCLIYFLQPGAELESVVFRPADGVVPLSWTGRVEPLAERAERARCADPERRGPPDPRCDGGEGTGATDSTEEEQ